MSGRRGVGERRPSAPLPLVGEGVGERVLGLVQSPSPGATRHPLPHAGEGIQNLAKALRKGQTEAEIKLWYHLRAHRFLGLKFKRQKPIGRYIVDFLCDEQQLVVELDGGQHNGNVDDLARDAWLKAQGLRVLRFWNDDVLKNTDAVLEQIRLNLSPLPRAGEGGPKGRERA